MSLTSRNSRGRGSRRSSGSVPDAPRETTVMSNVATVFLEACLKDFDTFAEKMLVSCGAACSPLIKSCYLQARRDPRFQWCLPEMDSTEEVLAYDLDRKLRELEDLNGPELAPKVHLLEPGETLMSAPFLFLVSGDAVPDCFGSALDGLKALWRRIVLRMQEDRKDLRRLEASINHLIRKQGGWKEIRLKSETYLRLLDPGVVSGPGWGSRPLNYVRTMQGMWREPRVEMTPEDARNHRLETIGELERLFLEPLQPPEKWHFMNQSRDS